MSNWIGITATTHQVITQFGVSSIVNLNYLDWTSKRETYANLLLRAYSQKIFDPLKILYENPSEDAFVLNVRPIMKRFIKSNMGDDDACIDREVCLTHLSMLSHFYILD
jgi:hypothetical protein